MRDVLSELEAWATAGEELAVATVVETWGSSPRPVGSRMLVTRSGKMAGSVSNGCIEGAVFEVAQEVLASGEARLVPFGVADDLAFEVGLACGGHVEVYVQPVVPAHLELADKLRQEIPVTLKTDLAGGPPELVLGAEAENPQRRGETFIEPFLRPPQMLILGAIHIAAPLHRLARLMGYRVVVADARSQFATRERFPEADEVLVGWPDEVLSRFTLDSSTYLVILTHDPKFDLPALRAALAGKPRYLGAIGSSKTNLERFRKLREEGFDDESLARVQGPIGLDLGGRSAEETALAIMAQVTAVRHDRPGGHMRRPQEQSAARRP